jgi:hypothetical protein
MAGAEVPAAAGYPVRHPQRPPLLVPVGEMLILLYFTEGIVRATTETRGQDRRWRSAETVLALIFFCASVGYARLTRPSAG